MNLTVKPIVPFNNDYQSAYNFKFATFLDTIRTLGHNRGTKIVKNKKTICHLIFKQVKVVYQI